MVVEVLAAIIRQNPNIGGIQHVNGQLKLAQFADDLTCFLSREEELRPLLDALHTFLTWSGLRTNKHKSKIISPDLLRKGKQNKSGIPVVDSAKVLGIWLGCDNSEEWNYNHNFCRQLKKCL